MRLFVVRENAKNRSLLADPNSCGICQIHGSPFPDSSGLGPVEDFLKATKFLAERPPVDRQSRNTFIRNSFEEAIGRRKVTEVVKPQSRNAFICNSFEEAMGRRKVTEVVKPQSRNTFTCNSFEEAMGRRKVTEVVKPKPKPEDVCMRKVFEEAMGRRKVTEVVKPGPGKQDMLFRLNPARLALLHELRHTSPSCPDLKIVTPSVEYQVDLSLIRGLRKSIISMIIEDSSEELSELAVVALFEKIAPDFLLREIAQADVVLDVRDVQDPSHFPLRIRPLVRSSSFNFSDDDFIRLSSYEQEY